MSDTTIVIAFLVVFVAVHAVNGVILWYRGGPNQRSGESSGSDAGGSGSGHDNDGDGGGDGGGGDGGGD